MASLAAARELHERFNYFIRVDGADALQFMKCSELKISHAKIEYWEGGAFIPMKVPGRMTMSDITLERGVGTSVDLHRWMLEVGDPAKAGGTGAGGLVAAFTRNIGIFQRDRPKARTLRRHNLFGAFPTEYVAGAWDNTVDEVVIETLTITFDRPETSTPGTGVLRGP